MVFPHILDMTRDDMLKVVELLGKYDVGRETQIIEKDVLRNLERLLDAIREDLERLKEEQKEEKKKGQKKGGGGKGKGMGGKPKDKQQERKPMYLPGIAEIKLLKGLQIAIQSDTIEVDRKYPEDGELSSVDKKLKKRICERLAGKESDIQRLTAGIVKKIEEAQKQQSGGR